MSPLSYFIFTFTYNGDGQRVQKQDSTGTTNHIWDDQNILLETNASNVIQVVYTLEPEVFGNLISQRRSGTTSFYLFDGLGSTTQIASSTGSVTDGYLYDSFGNILLSSGSTSNWFRYNGQLGYYYDTDLIVYYLRARYYNALLAGFVSRDPTFDRLPNTDFESDCYKYARNNPVGFSDPSGLQPPLLPPLLPPGMRPPPPAPPPPPPYWTLNPFTWGYGRYCGLWRVGPGDPIDAVDWACRRHDKCQATLWKAICNIHICTFKLCDDAMWALNKGCEMKYGKTSPAGDDCKHAAGDIQVLFCFFDNI